MRKLYQKPIGSTWRKWDLHIHSIHSKESSAKLSIRNIFELAIEKEISVISITDHSNVKALNEVWETYEDTFEKDGNICQFKDYLNFIPGVELKTDKGNKPIHLIVLFPKYIQKEGYKEKVDTNFLESEFLNKLGVTESKIREAGNGDYDKGLLSISVNFEMACELAHELGGITVVHNGSKKANSFDEGLAHSPNDPTEQELLETFNYLKTNLMTKYIDICEIQSLNKANIKKIEFYLEKFNKPCILCSDSHEDFKGDKYTWIKADPTFEGLKQILFEPKYRLYFGETPPIDPLHRIDQLTYNFPQGSKLEKENFCLVGQGQIYFSPNLTCLIGGRGSGKSTILNLIHEKLRPSENKFFSKHTIEIPGGMNISDCIKIDEDNDEKYIEFLSQNEIEEFALDHDKFTKAIFSRLEKLDERSSFESFSSELSNQMNEIDKIIQCWEKFSELSKTKANYTKELMTNKKLVASLNDEYYLKLINDLQSIDKEIQDISASKKKLVMLIKQLDNVLKNHTIENIPLNSSNSYKDAYNYILASLRNILEIVRKRDRYIDINKHEKFLEENLKKVQALLNKFLEDRGLTGENLRDVSEANKKINWLNYHIELINQQIEYNKKEIKKFQFNINLKDSYEEKIMNMLQELNEHLKELNEHVKAVELKYVFNFNKAKDDLLSEVIERFPKNDKYENLRNIEKYLFAVEPWELDSQEQFLKAISKENAKTKTYQSLYDYFSDKVNFEIYKLLIKQKLLNVEKYKTIKVYYDGRPLENTSFGQRCTAAIVVLLLLGNNPIIIDEPEAHLDSSLIAEYLVDLVKESKLKRQIIFATHNANFVINGDAELIHYLEMNSSKQTTITSMTIEDLENRKNLLRLEGGQKAFEKRERRYK